MSVTVYVLVLQIKSIVRQQHNLQEQQQNFYVLAEQMRLPVGEIVSEMPLEKWDFIEEKSSVLLGMTEETLSKAKAEALYESGHKRISLRTLSIVSITGIFLLLAIWSGYLYQISYKRMEFKVQDNFEKMFYEETYYNRYLMYWSVYKDNKVATKVTGNTPYVDRFLKNVRNNYLEKDIIYEWLALWYIISIINMM